MSDAHELKVTRLSSGYWHIRGQGPCNWAQPPHWPCDEEMLRSHAFSEASEEFIRAAVTLAQKAGAGGAGGDTE
jgi:hypothetical protein